jgi:hypothetical protein
MQSPEQSDTSHWGQPRAQVWLFLNAATVNAMRLVVDMA